MAMTDANNGKGHESFHFAFSFFSACRSTICLTTSDNGMPSLAASFSRKSSWRLVNVIDSLGFDTMMQICITFVNCQVGQTTQSVAVGTTDWVDLGAGPMVLQVASWLHAASHIANGG
jgi:hypothetical protein